MVLEQGELAGIHSNGRERYHIRIEVGIRFPTVLHCPIEGQCHNIEVEVFEVFLVVIRKFNVCSDANVSKNDAIARLTGEHIEGGVSGLLDVNLHNYVVNKKYIDCIIFQARAGRIAFYICRCAELRDYV